MRVRCGRPDLEGLQVGIVGPLGNRNHNVGKRQSTAGQSCEGDLELQLLFN